MPLHLSGATHLQPLTAACRPDEEDFCEQGGWEEFPFRWIPLLRAILGGSNCDANRAYSGSSKYQRRRC